MHCHGDAAHRCGRVAPAPNRARRVCSMTRIPGGVRRRRACEISCERRRGVQRHEASLDRAMRSSGRAPRRGAFCQRGRALREPIAATPCEHGGLAIAIAKDTQEWSQIDNAPAAGFRAGWKHRTQLASDASTDEHEALDGDSRRSFRNAGRATKLREDARISLTRTCGNRY